MRLPCPAARTTTETGTNQTFKDAEKENDSVPAGSRAAQRVTANRGAGVTVSVQPNRDTGTRSSRVGVGLGARVTRAAARRAGRSASPGEPAGTTRATRRPRTG